MSQQTHQTKLAILGGGSLVGRALELLLKGAGYDTLLLEEDTTAGRPEEFLEDVQLVLISPTLGDEFRGAFLERMRNTQGTADTPVLTLSTAVKESLPDRTYVSWPCRIEDLEKQLATVLQPAIEDLAPDITVPVEEF